MKSVKEINPFTGSPYSEDYYKLKEQREKLEIYKYNDQLIDLISKHHITIVESLPGSGKTTQIPQIILKSKLFDDHKQIICTEPRRSIAINAAKRVSKEIDVEFGEIVGFHIRFDSNDKHTTKSTVAISNLENSQRSAWGCRWMGFQAICFGNIVLPFHQ